MTVKEDNVKRLNWQMALVDEVIKGKDGKSRAAIIRIMDKTGKITRLKRPVQKLFPIELKTEKPKEPLSEFPITFVKQAKQESGNI